MSFSITGWWAKEFISAALTVDPQIIAKDIASLVALLDVGVDIDAILGKQALSSSSLTVSEVVNAHAGLLRTLSAAESVHPSLSGVGVRGVNSPGSTIVTPGASASVSLVRHVSASLNVSPIVTLVMLGNMSAHLIQDVNMDAEAHLDGLVRDVTSIDPSVVADAVRGAQSSAASLITPLLSVSATVSVPVPPAFDAVGSGYGLLGNNSPPWTWTHTAAAGADVFALYTNYAGNANVIAATYGGLPMTLLLKDSSYSVLFHIANVPGGASEVSVDRTSGTTATYSEGNSVSYTNVKNVGDVAYQRLSGTGLSQSVSCSAGQLIVNFIGSRTNFATLDSVSGGTLRASAINYQCLAIQDSDVSTTFSATSSSSSFLTAESYAVTLS